MKTLHFIKGNILLYYFVIILLFGISANELSGIGPSCEGPCSGWGFDACGNWICFHCEDSCHECTAEGCVSICNQGEGTDCFEACVYEDNGGCVAQAVGCKSICEINERICCEGYCCGEPGWTCHGLIYYEGGWHPRCCPPNRGFCEANNGSGNWDCCKNTECCKDYGLCFEGNSCWCEDYECCKPCCEKEDCESGCGPPPPPPPPPPPGGPPGGPPAFSGGSSAADPVFIKTGEFKRTVTDLSIPGRGISIDIKRTYRSRRLEEFGFGYGWIMNYDIKIQRLNDPVKDILFFNGAGNNHKFELIYGSNPPRYINLYKPTEYFLLSNNKFTLYKENGQRYEFDVNDKISSIKNRHNNSINFEYAGGRLMKITDTLNHEIAIAYEGNLIDTITDSSGRAWTYQYDPDTNDLLGVISPATDEYPEGLVTTYTYENHYLLTITDPNEDVLTHNYYDGSGRVWKQYVGGSDDYYQLDYNPGTFTTTVTDRQGHQKDMVYNDIGQLITEKIYTDDPQEQPNHFSMQYVYDPETGRRTRIDYPKGNCVEYAYDVNGNITHEYYKTDVNDPNDPCDINVIAKIYTFDINWPDEANSIKDALGNITYFDYNGITANLDQIRYPDSSSEQFTYNTYGQIETRTAADSIVTKYVYYEDANDSNNYGRLWKIVEDYNTSDGCNITMEFEYDALGRIIEVKDPNGDITQSKYNTLDQLIESITPSPYNYTTKFNYDAKGNQSKIDRVIGGDSEPNQVIGYVYNKQSKLVEITDPLGYLTKYGYNKNDEPNTVLDTEDNNTLTEYNERGFVSSITDANGGITRFGYDENGNLTDINDPNGNITRFEYDKFSRLAKIVYPDDSNERFGYDKNSNVTSKTTRKGDTITYQYNSMNQMTVKTRPGEPNTVFTYNIAGRLVDVNDGRTVANGGGITKYKYDRISRVTEVNDIYGKTVKYDYDKRGLRTKLDYPDAITMHDANYAYDALGRVTQINRGTISAAKYEYDQLSRRTKVIYGNNNGSISYNYDIGNRLMKITNDFYGDNNLVFDYNNYDKVGNRLTCEINDANTMVYAYDKLYQLTFVDYNDGNRTWYDYDKLGNRTFSGNGTQTSYESNPLNQYTEVNDVDYTYDKNGNLTFDGVHRYYYDCENRLTDVNNADDEAIVSYKYDYQGRRVSKADYTLSPTRYTLYLYDGDQIIADYNEAGVWKRRYYYGPGIDEPICMVRYPGVTTFVNYYYYDGLGSVVAMSDYAGRVVEKYSYDVFGEPKITDQNGVPRTTSAYSNRYLFTGREYDSETGLYYYRARYYHPTIGRFMQADPVGIMPDGGERNPFAPQIRYAIGGNLYIYAGNNAINFIDPFGLMDCVKRCELIYRIDVGICGLKWKINLCRGNPVGGAISWGICMHKARTNHMTCIEDCGDKDLSGSSL